MIALLLSTLLAVGTAAPIQTGPGESIATYTTDPPDGTGETVALVPGLTGCAFGFRHVVAGLSAAGFRIVIIEPLGVGASDRPAGADYSLTAQAGRLARALEAAGAGPALVVSHGVATSMALRLAGTRPDLVSGILSIEGGPDENCLTPTVERTLGLVDLAARLGAKKLIRKKFKNNLEAASGNADWIDGTAVRRYFRGFERDMSAAVTALRGMAEAQEPESLLEKLPAVGCPVVLMLGTAAHEGRPADEAIARMNSHLPDFRLQEVPGAGHFIMEEQPQAVIHTVLAMFAGDREPGTNKEMTTVSVLDATKGEGSCAQ